MTPKQRERHAAEESRQALREWRQKPNGYILCLKIAFICEKYGIGPDGRALTRREQEGMA